MVSHYQVLNDARGCGGPGNLVQHNSSRMMNVTEAKRMEANGSTRKRIAVACGRCRKRKIRCSGDFGTGVGCLNCQNAGVETCQFLRVSSQEVADMRPSEPSYRATMNRRHSPRSSNTSPTSSQTTSYAPNVTALGHDGTLDHYSQAQEWTTGYGGQQSAPYSPPHADLSLGEQAYMMAQYREEQPLVVRSTNPVYVNTDAVYSYGNVGASPGVGARHPAVTDGTYSFPNGPVCYSEPNADGSGQFLPLPGNRARNESLSTASPGAQRVSRLPYASEQGTVVSLSRGFDGSGSGTYGVSATQRDHSLYTNVSPMANLPGQGSPLRGPVTYQYRHTDSARERSSASGTMSGMDDQKSSARNQDYPTEENDHTNCDSPQQNEAKRREGRYASSRQD